MKGRIVKTIAIMILTAMSCQDADSAFGLPHETGPATCLSPQIKANAALLQKMFDEINSKTITQKKARQSPAVTSGLKMFSYNPQGSSLWPKIRRKVMNLGKEAFGTASDASTWPDIEQAFLSPNAVAFLLAERSKNKIKIDGYIVGKPQEGTDDVIELVATMVREKQERKGWGGKLTGFFVRKAVEQGFTLLRVETSNQTRIRLLKQSGCIFKNQTGTKFRPFLFFYLPGADVPGKTERLDRVSRPQAACERAIEQAI